MRQPQTGDSRLIFNELSRTDYEFATFGILGDNARNQPRTIFAAIAALLHRSMLISAGLYRLKRSYVADSVDGTSNAVPPANLCYAENIGSSPRAKGGNVRWVGCRPDPASRIQPARLRRGRALTEACSSSERQRSITSRLKRHSEPTRKPGSCFARSNRYTVVGCTRKYSDNSRTVSTVGGVGAEPDFFDRFSSTLTL
jgi:hypothetical protein